MAVKQTFEKAMTTLEKIVEELEGGELPLDKSLKKFEEGIQLSRFCSEQLDETEKKVTLLMQNEKGEVIEKPFGHADDSL